MTSSVCVVVERNLELTHRTIWLSRKNDFTSKNFWNVDILEKSHSSFSARLIASLYVLTLLRDFFRVSKWAFCAILNVAFLSRSAFLQPFAFAKAVRVFRDSKSMSMQSEMESRISTTRRSLFLLSCTSSLLQNPQHMLLECKHSELSSLREFAWLRQFSQVTSAD